MKIIVLLGRVLFALIFLAAAPRHFSQEGITHGADFGVPLAQFFVPLSGVMAIVGSLSVATGYRAKWGAWLLVLFLIPVTLGMHQFWTIADPTLRHVQLSNFAKNVSMLGAALMITFFGSGPLSVRAEDGSSARQ